MEQLGYNATMILSALARGARYGLEVMERTGLSSGTVYPALRRFEAARLVEAHWEDEQDAHAEGRPPRRYYLVTPGGRAKLEEALARIRERQRALGWVPESHG